MSNGLALIKLDKSSAIPLYTQLYQQFRLLIENGTFLPGTRLPSVRKAAETLGVNQITVVSAFRQLENEGFAYSRPGSGTFTADISLRNLKRGDATSFGGSISDELYSQDDLPLITGNRITLHENTINFASATPTPDLFPVDDFKHALNEVLERDKGNAFGYQESQGFYPLRESILRILRGSSMLCGPGHIQVISGAQQGIDIISKTLLRQGDCIVTESPTYTGAIAVFRSRDAHIADIPMEEDGPDMNLLEYNLKKCKPRILYTIPSFQNPTGYSYSNEKREALLSLAEKYDCYIIEDDYVSELDFEGRKYLPLKALDRYSRVIFIKSFSKLFMPGLRLGFMIVPEQLSGDVLAAKHTTDISTSGLIQRAFDQYIRNDCWDRHFAFMYNIYRERYQKTLSCLDKLLPTDCSFNRPGGGLNVWVRLPYGFPVNSLVNQAAAADVVFAPGRIFYSANSPQALNHLRISFAAVDAQQIETGLEKLCTLIRRVREGSSSTQNLPIL